MRIDAYDWSGGREAMLRFGPDTGPVMVVAMPLLAEWNRTRAFTAALCRALADRGVSSLLPDLPGHGESLLAIGDLTVPRIAEAMEAVTLRSVAEGRTPFSLALRSGALVDQGSPLHGRWQLSPMTGDAVLHDLHRTWLVSQPTQRSRGAMMSGPQDAMIAGQLLSPRFLSSLAAVEPFGRPEPRRRTVRLASDPRPADLRVSGAPLWRRAEPGDDPALALRLADDIAEWLATCGA